MTDGYNEVFVNDWSIINACNSSNPGLAVRRLREWAVAEGFVVVNRPITFGTGLVEFRYPLHERHGEFSRKMMEIIRDTERRFRARPPRDDEVIAVEQPAIFDEDEPEHPDRLAMLEILRAALVAGDPRVRAKKHMPTEPVFSAATTAGERREGPHLSYKLRLAAAQMREAGFTE